MVGMTKSIFNRTKEVEGMDKAIIAGPFPGGIILIPLTRITFRDVYSIFVDDPIHLQWNTAGMSTLVDLLLAAPHPRTLPGGQDILDILPIPGFPSTNTVPSHWVDIRVQISDGTDQSQHIWIRLPGPTPSPSDPPSRR
jgi:hypothetical protein